MILLFKKEVTRKLVSRPQCKRTRRYGSDSLPVRWAGPHVDQRLLVHGRLDGVVGVRGCQPKGCDRKCEDNDDNEGIVTALSDPLMRRSGHGAIVGRICAIDIA